MACFNKFLTKCPMTIYKWEWCCIQHGHYLQCVSSPFPVHALRCLPIFMHLYNKGSLTLFHTKSHYWKLKTNTAFIIDFLFHFNLFMIHSNHNKVRMGDKAAQVEKATKDSGWLLFMKNLYVLDFRTKKRKVRKYTTSSCETLGIILE